MDCREALMLVPYLRPNCPELDPQQVDAVEEHLRTCSTCRALTERERRLDRAIARAMQAVPIPPKLRGKLLDRTATIRGKQIRRRIYQVMALAASLLLIFYFTDRRSGTPVQPVELSGLKITAEQQADNPEAALTAWLGEQNLRLTPSQPFDFRRTVHFGSADFQGKRVPMILLAGADEREQVFAKVYLVRTHQFAVEPTATDGNPSFRKAHVVVLADELDATLRYVVVYTGASLKPFLKPELQPNTFAFGPRRADTLRFFVREDRL